MSSAVETAKKIVGAAEAVPAGPDLKRLVAELKGHLEFGLVRKVLKIAREGKWDKVESVWILQQLALSTYLDEELLPSRRFESALAVLGEIGLQDPEAIDPERTAPSTLPETLALGGAIYKRKWEYDGQLENLHQALALYHLAWDRDPRMDMGYGGVNAAFVLDLLASRERVFALRSHAKAAEAERLAARARDLRLDMLHQIPRFAAERASAGEDPAIENQYWYLATLAEIHFGLGNYEQAGQCLDRARRAPSPEWEERTTWERQTTVRQLIALARVQSVTPPAEGADPKTWHPAWRALHDFLGEDTFPALLGYRGRVGLALSGGGFRASLFHLGVLARLAEVDGLRGVEVLSTVSGGSILGAHYYLEVRKLLQGTKDGEIKRGDYVEIVRRVIGQFLEGVQRNLRTRVLTNVVANLKMALSKSYSRSHRLGELYEANLYSRVNDCHPSTKPRVMPEMVIKPVDAPEGGDFKPKFSNWRRQAKVPVLLLNATSLNSGHSWQFTARSMGEPPGLVGPEIDANERYRRLWYDQAPTPEFQRYRLGYAVAASACVPGLFDPLVLDGLYPGRTVRLVDGGVHDNQGVEGLINEGCTLLLCSDASGQMADVKRPSDGLLGVPLRSNSILMSRVREAEYQDLKARIDSRALQGLLFVHLKKGLEPAPLDWIRCQDPTVPPLTAAATTSYGVDKDLQRKLAAIRTDLDSFTEVEAYALMLSGYLMTEHELKVLDARRRADGEPGTWGGFDVDAPRGDWPFLELDDLIRQPPDASDARRQDLGKQLEVGASLAFKIWKLSPVLNAIALATLATLLVAFGWVLGHFWNTALALHAPSVSVRSLVVAAVLAILGMLVPALQWLHPRDAMRSYGEKALLAIAGFLLCNIHLRAFDWLYLRRGKLKRLLELP
jgi:predicted acylesterase/phospholipase RssA